MLLLLFMHVCIYTYKQTIVVASNPVSLRLEICMHVCMFLVWLWNSVQIKTRKWYFKTNQITMHTKQTHTYLVKNKISCHLNIDTERPPHHYHLCFVAPMLQQIPDISQHMTYDKPKRTNKNCHATRNGTESATWLTSSTRTTISATVARNSDYWLH